jgi:hypothetical protein
VRYWSAIAEHYRLDLDVVNKQVDSTFRFMTVDWDGQIRMDPSSSYAMQGLIGLKERFDVAFACDRITTAMASSPRPAACWRRTTTWRCPSTTCSRTARNGAPTPPWVKPWSAVA